MIESLENRRLLAFAPFDYITSTQTVEVEMTAASETFKAKSVSSLDDSTFGGADRVFVLGLPGTVAFTSYDSHTLDENISDRIRFADGVTPKYLVGTMGDYAFAMPLGTFSYQTWARQELPVHNPQERSQPQLIGASVLPNRVLVTSVPSWVPYTNPTNPRLRVEAQGGDDLVTIDSSVKNIRVSIFGANGNDTIVGGTYIDSLYGGAGDDVITSFAKIRAYIEGNGGNDILKGGSAPDSIQGDAGDDWLDGGPAGSLTGDTSTQPQQRAMPSISARKPTNTGTNTGINTGTSTHTPISNYTIDHLYGGSDYDTAVRDDHDYREGIEHLI